MVAFYGFGDASGAGFGSTFSSALGTHYRYGLWGNDLTGASSNYRELFNLTEAAEAHVKELAFAHLSQLVDAVAGEALRSPLQGSELFLFTDNGVAEAAFYKGTSSNPRLFALLVRLKQLELEHAFTIQLIHVAGWRMQAQGTDGLSRGDLLSGVMQGQDLLSFIPLHLAAPQRSVGVIRWVSEWILPSQHLVQLQPIDWFGRGHGVVAWSVNGDGVPSPTSDESSSSVHKGPAFSNKDGTRLPSSWVEMEILDHLHTVQSNHPELIPKEVNVYEEYGISRSFCRGATTQARNQKVAENDINLINRWRQVEGAQGHQPKLQMQDHYSEIRQMVPSLLRFSLAL